MSYKRLPLVENVRITDLLREEGIPFTPGYLMNRERLGIPLRHAIRGCLVSMDAKTLALDFTDIEEISISVAEEIGPKLFEDFLEYRNQNKEAYLVYCNLTQEIAEGLGRHFLHRDSRLDTSVQFTMVAFQQCVNDQFTEHFFLGEAIPGALAEVLNLIYTLGEATSQSLEERGIKAASRKLNELVKQYPWLIWRNQQSVDTSARAWAYCYSPVVPIAIAAKEV